MVGQSRWTFPLMGHPFSFQQELLPRSLAMEWAQNSYELLLSLRLTLTLLVSVRRAIEIQKFVRRVGCNLHQNMIHWQRLMTYKVHALPLGHPFSVLKNLQGFANHISISFVVVRDDACNRLLYFRAFCFNEDLDPPTRDFEGPECFIPSPGE